jgi:hypothetical protein
MRYRIPLLAFWILCLVQFAIAQEATDKPLYQLTGNEATITGAVNVTGAIPKPLRIDTAADPVCTESNPQLNTDDWIVHENSVQNAFVYVKSDSLAKYRFAMPETDAVLVQRNCQMSPHVFGMRAGQKLQVVNADQTQHNVHPTPKNNPEWNQSHPAGAPPITKTFTRPEVLIPVKDNQHPWEKAYVGVMDHPFFAVTDEFGRFEIRGLPPGIYTLVVWHERLGEQQVEIAVAPGEIRNADFTFDADKRPNRPSSGSVKPQN